jgi:hypothetical protein
MDDAQKTTPLSVNTYKNGIFPISIALVSLQSLSLLEQGSALVRTRLFGIRINLDQILAKASCHTNFNPTTP